MANQHDSAAAAALAKFIAKHGVTRYPEAVEADHPPPAPVRLVARGKRRPAPPPASDDDPLPPAA